jgi:leucyl/phenylalanyl-tRNA--protein transferase
MSNNRTAPFFLDPEDIHFPDASLALRDPDGLLAIGGDLSPARLLEAYRHGIFPWYSDDQPILWWSPDPRMVLYPQHLKISRRLRRTLKRGVYRVTINQAFTEVMARCTTPRREGEGTWITNEMQTAYQQLHAMGHAHSLETWHGDILVGGLYGVACGPVFSGESMFALRPDASKVALVYLAEQLQDWGYTLIDCQVYTAHLASLGAEEIPRARFIQLLQAPDPGGQWPRRQP